MTRSRKLTLSVKEFSHLVSESLDIANSSPSPQSFVETTAVVSEISQKHNPRQSSFHRFFSRPPATPVQHEDSQERSPENLSYSPRKMITWPFSRSPRKVRSARHEGSTTEDNDPVIYNSVSPYSITSLATASTSSLGSLVPADECLFQVTSRNSGEPSRNCPIFTSPITPPTATASGCYTTGLPLDVFYGSSVSTSGSDSIELASSTLETRTSSHGTDASHSVAMSEPENFDQDPTPRATTFDPHIAALPAKIQDDPLLSPPKGCSRRLPLIEPLQDVKVQALPLAAETELLASACPTSSPTSSAVRSPSPTFSRVRPSDSRTSSLRLPPTSPKTRVSSAFPDIASPSNLEPVQAPSISPRQRKRAISRSVTPPPLTRPPPTGPLPAVPSCVPPVPPLPPLLNKISPHSVVSSPPRSSVVTNPTAALPPSPPGGLRLPSRLSWVNSVRAVLPSPPASPTKSLKSLTGKVPLPVSPSKTEKRRSKELKRPTSIGVIEAADNVQVRRTKSILLLGSRSKSSTSLGTKRVQIHADVNLDSVSTRKPRRKSSSATVSHPIFSSEATPRIASMTSSELLVLRERRYSAPLLSSSNANAPRISADWTLSLPLCTDVPGSKILLSPLLTPQLTPDPSLEDVNTEDWTLCMPLKLHGDTSTIESSERRDSECTTADTSEATEAPIMQLPTPSPSPTWSTPSSAVRSLDPEEKSMPMDRPASRASLGPHAGGLDLDGGRGKRASGWHVYGWFDEVNLSEDEHTIDESTTDVVDTKHIKSHVAVFRKTYERDGRHPSKESMSTVSTSETTFYSARSSLLIN